MNLFISYLFKDPLFFFSAVAVVCFSISFHEFCHAWAAKTQGDTTAADRGHLTLDPLKQMGLISLLMLLVLGIAWGQVPVDRSRMRHRYSDALVSFAGPAANLFLYVVFTVGLALLIRFLPAPDGELHPVLEELLRILFYAAMINLVLAIFNLLPLPGLDGWHILADFQPQLQRTESEFIRGFFLVLIMVGIFFINRLFAFAEMAVGALLKLVLVLIGAGS